MHPLARLPTLSWVLACALPSLIHQGDFQLLISLMRAFSASLLQVGVFKDVKSIKTCFWLDFLLNQVVLGLQNYSAVSVLLD